MEFDSRKCKICGYLKLRVAAEAYPNGKDKKFVDENKRLWNGKVCPSCNGLRLKDVMQKKRLYENT